MNIRAYLAEEGIEKRMGLDEFEKLKESAGLDFKTEYDTNSARIDNNPNIWIKEEYRILAKYKLLSTISAVMFEELIAQTPCIAERLKTYHKVLDAGCGDALKLAYYAHECPASSFLGIDYCLESIALAEERIKKRQLANAQVQVLDIADVQSLGETFDCITATNVLHERHSAAFGPYSGKVWRQDITAGLTCLSQVIRTGGRLMFTLHFPSAEAKEYITRIEINPGIDMAGFQTEEQIDLVFNHFDYQTINGLWVCRKN